MKELEDIVRFSFKNEVAPAVILLGATLLSAALLSSRSFTAGIGTMVQLPVPGCRGFIGPVPPPLWIEVPFWGYLIVHILALMEVKVNKTNSREDAKMQRTQRSSRPVFSKTENRQSNTYSSTLALAASAREAAMLVKTSSTGGSKKVKNIYLVKTKTKY